MPLIEVDKETRRKLAVIKAQYGFATYNGVIRYLLDVLLGARKFDVSEELKRLLR